MVDTLSFEPDLRRVLVYDSIGDSENGNMNNLVIIRNSLTSFGMLHFKSLYKCPRTWTKLVGEL